MNGKDIFIDFLNYAFLIVIIILCLIFFVVGDRFETFTVILKSMMPLAFFASIFIFFLKRKRKQKLKKGDNLDEVVIFLTKADKRKDIVVIILLFLVIFTLSYLSSDFLISDVVQVLFIFLVMASWHYILFKKNSYENHISITVKKILNDEIIISLLPIMFYVPMYFFGTYPNIKDVFQSLILFIVMYSWHYIFFEKGRVV